MRLRKINLAGFKSFVDPTTIAFPGELTGIVGPNGCGKSNVIDAVRWVMGEMSAKHLRGESMADVVFNGSNSRKPVGQASVELVFELFQNEGDRFLSVLEVRLLRLWRWWAAFAPFTGLFLCVAGSAFTRLRQGIDPAALSSGFARFSRLLGRFALCTGLTALFAGLCGRRNGAR